MERKAAITTAAAITLTLLAGGSAMAANLGILDQEPASGLGETSPVSVPSDGTASTVPDEVRTIIVDETLPDGSSGGTSGTNGTTGSTTVSSTPTSFDDSYESDDVSDDVSDDESEDVSDDSDREDEHEDEHEYEGSEDDD